MPPRTLPRSLPSSRLAPCILPWPYWLLGLYCTQFLIRFLNYSYAVGVDVTIVVGCIVDKRWVIEENFLHG